jgi:hypothetical protein
MMVTSVTDSLTDRFFWGTLASEAPYRLGAIAQGSLFYARS